MSTTPISPAAPAAAPAASPAPVAAPAPAAPAPAAAPAPTEPAAPAAAPVVPAAPAANPDEGKSLAQLVKESIKTAPKPGEEPAAPAAAPEKKDPDAAAAADAPKHDDPNATKDDKSKEDAAAAAAAAAALDPDEEPAPEDLITLEDSGYVTPESLSKEASALPELAAAFEKNPALKAELFKTLRHASEALKVKAIIPTESAAKFVTSRAQVMQDIEVAFTNPDAGQGYEQLLSIMGGLDVLRDEETGDPILENGKPVRQGKVDNFLVNTAFAALDGMEEDAKASGDDEYLAAVQLVKERNKQPSSALDPELPEHLKAEAERIRTESQKLDAKEKAAKVEKRKAVESTLREELTKRLDNVWIDAYFKKTDLDDFSKKHLRQEAKDMWNKALNEDPVFVAQRDYLVAQPQTKAVVAQRKALVRDAMAEKMPRIMRAVLAQARKTVKSDATARSSELDAKQTQTRHEPKGGGAAPIPAAQQSVEEATAQYITDYKTKNGREPSMLELVKFSKQASAGR